MSPPRSRARRAWRGFKTVTFVAAVVLWAIFLRPQFLGGPAQLILVSGTSMEPQMHSGDLVLVMRGSGYRVGERVAYRIPRGEPAAGRVVIHRIVGGSPATGFAMRGDNRATNDRWRPVADDIVGTARLRIPAAGRVARAILTPIGLGLLGGLAAFAFIAIGPEAGDPRGRRRVVSAVQAPELAVELAPPRSGVPASPVASSVSAVCAAAPPIHRPAPVPAPSPAAARRVPGKPQMTVRVCLVRTAANLRQAGRAARARRLRRPAEPQRPAITLIELAAGVQHAASRWRSRQRRLAAAAARRSGARSSAR